MRANKARNPQQAPLEQRAIKRRSSLPVSCRHSNRKNSLAIYIADVFDKVRTPQSDVRSATGD